MHLTITELGIALNLLFGVIGGLLAGAMLKNLSLGKFGNLLAGLLGGGAALALGLKNVESGPLGYIAAAAVIGLIAGAGVVVIFGYARKMNSK